MSSVSEYAAATLSSSALPFSVNVPASASGDSSMMGTPADCAAVLASGANPRWTINALAFRSERSELEFGGTEIRIEWSGSRGQRYTKKGHRRFGPVRQDDLHPVAAADIPRIEPGSGAFHLTPQALIRQGVPARRSGDRRCFGI